MPTDLTVNERELVYRVGVPGPGEYEVLREGRGRTTFGMRVGGFQ